jgi:HD superfamily phosphohydrolase
MNPQNEEVAASSSPDTPKLEMLPHTESARMEHLSKRCKVINDPLHHEYSITVLEKYIIDTLYFQKLREQKQLGFCDKLYPGAHHTRFEHSLGAGYIAERMVQNIVRNSSKEEMQPAMQLISQRFGLQSDPTPWFCLLVKIAAVCHDIGHGPFSHLFDDIVLEGVDVPLAEHEVRSGAILELIVQHHRQRLGYDILTPGELGFIKSLIEADGVGWPYQLVSNELNGYDVDKYDYLHRDAQYLGVKTEFNSRRLVLDATVVAGDVCYPEGHARELFNMSHARYSLFNKAYCHKTTICVQVMWADIMRLIEPDLKMVESVKQGDMKRFCDFTDEMVLQWVKAHKEHPAYSIWLRMVERHLYRHIGSWRKKAGKDDKVVNLKQAVWVYWKGAFPALEDEFVVHVSKIGYLSGNRKNPMESLPLFITDEDTGERQRVSVDKSQVSTFIPDHHQEFVVMLIWKGTGSKRVYVDAFKKLVETLD